MIKCLHLNGLGEPAKNKNKNIQASYSAPSPVFQSYGYRSIEGTTIREKLGFTRPGKEVWMGEKDVGNQFPIIQGLLRCSARGPIASRREWGEPWEYSATPDANPASGFLSAASVLVCWLTMCFHQASAPGSFTLSQLWSTRPRITLLPLLDHISLLKRCRCQVSWVHLHVAE